MAIDKVDVWDDPRVQKRSAHLNGRTYGYLYSEPEKGFRGTIFLIHGFPDLSMGWRYQIPMLLSLGLRVVAPDCMGYGRTDAPPYKLHDYSFKRISDDMAELARQLGADQIILGGHDWGGAVVYRIALYHPTLTTALFSICTPYFPPNKTYTPLTLLTRTALPSFTYQAQFASGAIEEAVQSRSELKGLLNAFYGGWAGGGGDDNKSPNSNSKTPPIFNPEVGIDISALASHSSQTQTHTPLLTAPELDYYATEFSRNGIHAPLNWYRTRELNWADEYEHFFRFGDVESPPRLEQEVLFVLATRDAALRTELARGMVEGGKKGGVVERLRRREVQAGHWALWERPEELNAHVEKWLEEVVLKKMGELREGGMSGKGGSGSKL